jgi:predicted Holliday junction resolvase-like endonuclease
VIYLLFSLIVLLLVVNSIFIFKFLKQQKPQQSQTPIVKIDLKQIEKMIEQMPNKVLQSITSSTNGIKGATGELIGWLKLQSEYDRVIPLNDVVDFLGLKMPTDKEKGYITFIDIKTGKARLSDSQRKLKQIIKDKNIRFEKYNISISNQIEKEEVNE